jgi:hypothetical protein
MGHLSAIGGSAQDALATVRDAASRVGVTTDAMPAALRAFAPKRT